MPYCPKCGSQIEAEAAFCGDCGVRLKEQAQPPEQRPPEQQPPTPGWAAKVGTTPWSLLGGLVVVGGLALGLAALYDAAANNGDWADSIFGGGGGEEASVAAPSPTAEATVEPSPTREPRPRPTVRPPAEQPTVVPPTWGYATPEDAIDAFLGVPYIGDCEWANLETDVGYYCSFLWEDRIDTLVYAAGPTFSEPDTWLVLAPPDAGGDWMVIDWADFVPEEAGPSWQGYITPEDAIDAFLTDYDVPYIGDCEWASLETDVGYYCSLLWEDRLDTLIYVVGPTFSEPDTWLLLVDLGVGDDWVVTDAAEFVPGPQDTVPPW